MSQFTPFNLKQWIETHRDLLKPPVGNQLVWQDRQFIVMVVGGPNARDDYHVNQGEEFFYQLEGDIVLRIMDNDTPKDIPIREGDIYLLPAAVPHSPQRPANSIGLVIEKQRQANEQDGFQWYCANCHHKIYEDFLHIDDIVKQLPEVFEKFAKETVGYICEQCGYEWDSNTNRL